MSHPNPPEPEVKPCDKIDILFAEAEKARFDETAYIAVDELKASIKEVVSMLDRKYQFVCGVSDEQIKELDSLRQLLATERDRFGKREIELMAEVEEQCRLNGKGSEREADLIGKVERWRFRVGELDNIIVEQKAQIERMVAGLQKIGRLGTDPGNEHIRLSKEALSQANGGKE